MSIQTASCDGLARGGPDRVAPGGRIDRESGRAWLRALVVGLIVRLVVVAFVHPQFLDPGRDHWEFGYETGRVARSLVEGRGFASPYWADTGPTALLAPVYPSLMALVFTVAGVNTRLAAIAMLAINSLGSALTCVPMFFLARSTFGLGTANRAVWLWAVFPYAVSFSAALMWCNSLVGLLVTAGLLVTSGLASGCGGASERRLLPWLGMGLLWGLAALTNPVVLGVAPLLIAWACERRRRAGSGWRVPAAAAALGLLCVIGPWMIRNYGVFHRLVFLKDNFWLEVYVGNVGNARHWWNGEAHPSGNEAEMAEFARLGEQGYLSLKAQQSLAYIGDHPGTFVWRSIRRAVYLWTGFWSLRRDYLREEPFDPPNMLFCTMVTVLAARGLCRALRDRAPEPAAEGPRLIVPFVILLAVFPLAYYVTHPDLSFRQPIDPEVVILTVYGLGRRNP